MRKRKRKEQKEWGSLGKVLVGTTHDLNVKARSAAGETCGKDTQKDQNQKGGLQEDGGGGSGACRAQN